MTKNEIINLYKEHIINTYTTPFNEMYIEINKESAYEIIVEIISMLNGILVTMFCVDELNNSKLQDKNYRYTIYYVFKISKNNSDIEKELLILKVRINSLDPKFESITNICLRANWYEREIYDMFGLLPLNHLNLKRLVHHNKFPNNIFPLRKDFNGKEIKYVNYNLHNFKSQVSGEGVYLLPVGPIHAGIIEPGYFLFSCFGEHIINLDAQLFYTHKGIEKMTEGQNYIYANLISERVCGVCSLSHSVAFANAVEKLANIEIPLRAKILRTIFLELERIAAHLTDIMGIAVDVAYYHASNYISKLREDILSLAYDILKSRYFRSINTPGGLRRDIKIEDIKKIKQLISQLKNSIITVEDMLYSSTTFLERVETTGKLFTKTANALGIVGVGARASNIQCDVRKSLPYEFYNNITFNEIIHNKLDVYSRLCVRIDEIKESISIIEQSIDSLKDGPYLVKIEKIKSFEIGIGIVEAPKGEHVHVVMFDENSLVYRYHIRSASYINWPALSFAVLGNIVPDFPVINKSFNLCYSSCDK